MKKYKAKIGATFGNKTAQKIGERLEKISKKGKITPIMVVDDARNKKSPLHKFFDWSDSSAAKKYRLHQARLLINHIEVVIEIAPNKQKSYNSYLNISYGRDNKQYIDFETVINNKKLRAMYLSQALNEAISWQNRYNDYQELSSIFDAISLTKKVLKKKKVYRETSLAFN